MGDIIQVFTESFLLSVAPRCDSQPLDSVGCHREDRAVVTSRNTRDDSYHRICPFAEHNSHWIVVGIFSIKLSKSYKDFSLIVAPLVLLSLGVIYLVLDSKTNHGHHNVKNDNISRKSKFAIVTSLAAAMFFSPCIEIEAYYIRASAKSEGFGIGAVSITYLVVTVLGMLLLVDLGRRGIERFRSHFLEHHERGITGAVLVFIGNFCFYLRTYSH